MKKIIDFAKKEKLLLAVLIIAASLFVFAISEEKQEVIGGSQFMHTLTIEEVGEFELLLEEGNTAGDALEKASLEFDFELAYIDYDFGRMVQAISGLEADNQNFWALYYNNEMATVGADSLVLKEGDSTEWKFEELSF